MGKDMDMIFDIDGTLVDITHRLHFIKNKPKNWEKFYEEIKNDRIIEEMGLLLNTIILNPSNRVVFCTGRHEKYRETTEIQISEITNQQLPLVNNKTEESPFPLYMRKNNDFRPDYEVKSEILDSLIKDGFQPKLVFDDRTSVVEMWRSRGIRCLQVSSGNF